MKQATLLFFFWPCSTFLFGQLPSIDAAYLNNLSAQLTDQINRGDSKSARIMADSIAKVAHLLESLSVELAADAYLISADAFRMLYEDSRMQTLSERAIELYRPFKSVHALKYAKSLALRGASYASNYQNEKALKDFKEAGEILNLKENAVSEENAILKYEMGTMYNEQSQFHKAEKLLLESIEIYQNIGLGNQAKCVMVMRVLGSLYRNTGNYESSIDYHLRVLKISKENLPTNYHLYSQDLIAVGHDYSESKNFSAAKPYFDEAYEIFERTQEKNSTDYRTRTSFGSFFMNTKQFERAEDLFKLAVKYSAQIKGEGSFDHAIALHNLGNLYLQWGKYDVAEPIMIKTIELRERLLENKHLRYGRSLSNYSTLLCLTHRYYSAENLRLKSWQIFKSLILQSASHYSIYELQQHLAYYDPHINSMFMFNFWTNSETIRKECYDFCLTFKGFLLENILKIERLAHSKNDNLSEKILRWKLLQINISDELNKPTPFQKELPELNRASQNLEKEIVNLNADFQKIKKNIQWQEVQSKLRNEEAAIEFFHLNYLNDIGATDSTLYAALILRPDDAAPQFVYLFEKREIEPLLKNARSSNYQKINDLYDQTTPTDGQKSLNELIWKPLEPHLAGVKKVYCSPAGLLHQINLGAIKISEKETFADRHQLITMGSTRQLVVNFHPEKTAASDAYLAGGIRYSMDSTAIATANLSRSRGLPEADELNFVADTTSRGSQWNYLPETRREVLEINDLLKKSGTATALDTGFVATEEAFRSLGVSVPSPRIVHLSTHGFFFPEVKNRNEGRRMKNDEPAFKISEHPMIRTGLIMAGGNQVWTGRRQPQGMEDGILTAYEISQMNLSNTELVVLSACETGLGDIAGNEGVYGLQRAFKIAGAKYLIMSLWKVNDQSTRELMTEFYRKWLVERLEIPAAFQAAQASLRARYPDAPFHWAGFVLVE